MNDLDHLTISRILGSTVRPISRPAFGGFSAVGAVGQMLANRPIEAMDELEASLHQRCRWLSHEVHQIASRVRYHWWPQDAAASA